MNLSAFQTGLKDMFVITASAFYESVKSSRGAVVRRSNQKNRQNQGNKHERTIAGPDIEAQEDAQAKTGTDDLEPG
ncbi:MAG: hypothetical protein ABGZ17_11975, partial [Planctomycetaceae bacterium]